MSVPYSFLMSSERSGTNLLTRMLDAHPDICGPAPTHMIRTFTQNIGRYGDLALETNWQNLLTDVVDFLSAQLGKWQTSVDVEYLEKTCREHSLGAIIRAVYEQEMRAAGRQHVFVKENQAYVFAPFLLVEFPLSRFVYLVRDPRDVALSWKRSANHPGGIRKAMDVWLRDQNGFVALEGFMQATDRVALVRYEDLIENPEDRLKRIASHLGVSYSDTMLMYHEDPVTRQNAARIRNWDNLSKPVIGENKKKYRDGLTTNEILYIETRCADLMGFFGYELESNADMPADVVETYQDEVSTHEVAELTVAENDIRERRLGVVERIISRPLMPSSDLL